uniref:Uncharacterized protein n=1 Tax=Oryza brachyantha TaxID=4533 RepID=J3L6W1_ORYBR
MCPSILLCMLVVWCPWWGGGNLVTRNERIPSAKKEICRSNPGHSRQFFTTV